MTSIDLYSLALHIAADLESDEGVAPDVLAPRLAEYLDGAADKIGAIRYVLTRFESDDALLKAEADAIAAARERMARQSEHVKARAVMLLEGMALLGESPKVSRPTFSAWLTTSTSVATPPDAAELPAEFVRVVVTTSPDKAAIKAAIQGGRAVPGCALVESHGVTFRAAK
jgi:hypothetical protein